MQQVRLAQPPTNPISVVSPPLNIHAVLAAHRIESELQTPVPRVIEPKKQGAINTLWISALLILLAPLVYVWAYYPHWALFYTTLPLLVSLYLAGRGLDYLNRLPQKSFLETASPRAAVVSKLEPLADGKSYRLTFVYETPFNPRTIEAVSVTSEEVAMYGLQRGTTFTLLVARDNERNVLPYFQTTSFQIAGTRRTIPLSTAPNRIITPPLTIQPAVQRPIAAEWGVESELFCVAPRRVVASRSSRRFRLWMINWAFGVAGFVFYLYQCNGDFSNTFLTILAGVLFCSFPFGLFAWIASEVKAAHGRFYLQHGYAVRATVERCELERESGFLSIRFRYPRKNGEIGHGYLTLWETVATRLGGMAPGTTFTVLRHPSEAYTVVPYFEISGVEIPGAAPVGTIPPGTSTP